MALGPQGKRLELKALEARQVADKASALARAARKAYPPRHGRQLPLVFWLREKLAFPRAVDPLWQAAQLVARRVHRVQRGHFVEAQGQDVE